MKQKISKKAQIITFDLSSSIIIFLIFIAIFIGLIFLAQSIEEEHDFELEYVFANLENNLQYDDPAQNRDFIRDYRVNKEKLNKFVLTVSDSEIDEYVIGNETALGHGIGLDKKGYDACLYFTDNDGNLLNLPYPTGSKQALGWLTKPQVSCHEEINAGKNPCERYKQALSLLKPVLFVEGGPDENRILQMNLVICKK
ncbi:hypothetical protein AYK26_06895 [Euryarchaeota archaeon SM23-78]|nr:MAG: hypothetical protein AYK26_06895 [Euryarchaeota archaeon SM23-78]MBW3000390.1 hypothetical protein [Candidatus Woesearchaeota archaeon]